MNIAVILAAGSGSRFGSDIPKQYLEVAGRSVLAHSIAAFDSHPAINRVMVVVAADRIASVRAMVAAEHFGKVTDVIAGGKERYHSTMAALKLCPHPDDMLLFHDAARPMVSHAIIDRCVAMFDRYDAVDVAVKATDTILVVDSDDVITDIPMRATLRNSQTPQCFRCRLLKQAYKLALADPYFTATDDCGVVRRYMPNVPIKVVDGEPSNIKLTYASDIIMAENFLR